MSSAHFGSTPHSRSFDGQSLSAPGKKQLESQKLLTAWGEWLGAHALEASPQAPVQRA
jgi:hypothetical protein